MRTGPGHHAYLGGLLEHTVAVATLAMELCTLHPRLDRDLLLCAAIVHDLGKTREFTYGAEIARSQEGRMLGHIELGLRVIAAHVPPELDAERRLALEHCVISHHGAEAAAGSASPRPRRSRCTGSMPLTRRSRARSSAARGARDRAQRRVAAPTAGWTAIDGAPAAVQRERRAAP